MGMLSVVQASVLMARITSLTYLGLLVYH